MIMKLTANTYQDFSKDEFESIISEKLYFVYEVIENKSTYSQDELYYVQLPARWKKVEQGLLNPVP